MKIEAVPKSKKAHGYRWVQLFWEEVSISRKGGKKIYLTKDDVEGISHPSGATLFPSLGTAKDDERLYYVDSASKTYPNYGLGSVSYIRTASSIALFDSPSDHIYAKKTKKTDYKPQPGELVTRVTHFDAYLVRDDTVLYGVSWKYVVYKGEKSSSSHRFVSGGPDQRPSKGQLNTLRKYYGKLAAWPVD